LAVSLGCAVLVLVVVALAGWTPRVEYVLALAAVAAVTTVALRRVGASMVEAMWPLPFPPEPVTPGVDTRVGALESLVRRSAEDPAIFERRLQPLLADVVAHRLRREHGVDLDADPADARRLLGDEAWTLLTEVPRRHVSPSRLARTVTAIEQVGPAR
jgi:hypothetical protein